MMMETRIEYTNTRALRHIILDHMDGPARGFIAWHPTAGRYTAAGTSPANQRGEVVGHLRRARAARGRSSEAVPCHGWSGVIVKNVLNQSVPLDLVFQALSDPSRRVMVERLSRGPASVSELARPLAMSLPAVVQHLQVLEASGLVRSEKVGRVRTCRIEPQAFEAAEQWIVERRASWERRLDRLGDYLAEHPDEPARKK